MTDLADAIPSLQRAVATPGTFATTYPLTTNNDLLGCLMDGLSEVQMDGFLNTYVLDDFGVVGPDLTRGQLALVLIYSACRWVQSELKNIRSSVRYKAGNAEYETTQAATVMAALLKDWTERKKAILLRGLTAAAGLMFSMADRSFINAVTPIPGSSLYDFWANDVARAYDAGPPGWVYP